MVKQTNDISETLAKSGMTALEQLRALTPVRLLARKTDYAMLYV